jgi:hypothetical protein
LKRSFSHLALALGLACMTGCVMMPPAPYGRALLRGQNETSGGFEMAYRPDSIRYASESTSGFSYSGSIKPVQYGEYLFLYAYYGRGYGLSTYGTEWGWQLTLLTLEPALYFRQALRRPTDPQATALAFQADGVWGLVDNGSLSASLVATKKLGSKLEGTLALRGGWQRYPLLGEGNGWGWVYDYGQVESTFADLVASIGLDRGGRRISLEFVARLPFQNNIVLEDSTYTASYFPYTSTHYHRDVVLAPSLFLALRTSVADFASYAAQTLVLPRRWTVRPSPDTLSSGERWRLAGELSKAGLWADAADEYQQVLREDPALTQVHMPLAELYLVLGEPELALYHAQRAQQIGDHSLRAQQALAKAEKAVGAKP